RDRVPDGEGRVFTRQQFAVAADCGTGRRPVEVPAESRAQAAHRSRQSRQVTMTRTIDIPNLEATEAFGRRLGELLFPGAVVALVGQLGAGKTHLTRAVAEGLSVKNPAAVNSPTFVLIQEYPARLPIYHFDAYRLGGPREFAELGADEYFCGDGGCLVEWADQVEA